MRFEKIMIIILKEATNQRVLFTNLAIEIAETARLYINIFM
jgi:hypothetical protein